MNRTLHFVQLNTKFFSINNLAVGFVITARCVSTLKIITMKFIYFVMAIQLLSYCDGTFETGKIGKMRLGRHKYFCFLYKKILSVRNRIVTKII